MAGTFKRGTRGVQFRVDPKAGANLVLMAGFPGSGKSHIVKALVGLYSSLVAPRDFHYKEGVIVRGKPTPAAWASVQSLRKAAVINPDAIRIALVGKVFDKKREPDVWAFVRTSIVSAFEYGYKTVLLDSCNICDEWRKTWTRCKAWHTRAIVVAPDEGWARKNAIAKGIPNRVFDSMHDRCDIPSIKGSGRGSNQGIIFFDDALDITEASW